jgi:outer membrane protein, heavy metal efflux system
MRGFTQNFLILPLSVAAMFIAYGSAWAQSAATLSLPEAIALALNKHPDLVAAKLEIEASEGAVLQGGTRPNPELAITQEGTRLSDRSTALQLNWPIELGEKRRARVAAARLTQELARADLAQTRMDVHAAVVTTFLEALSAQQRAQLAQESYALAEQTTHLTGKRVIAGKLSPVEETKARVAQAQLKMELAQAHAEYRALLYKLALLWGDVAPQFEQLDGQLIVLPQIPSLESVEQRLAKSPRLRRSEVELLRRQALTQVEISKQGLDPTVSLGLKRSAGSSNQILFGVTVPLSLYDRNQGNLLESRRREDKALQEQLSQKLRLHSEALQIRERMVAARSELGTLRDEVLPGAQSAYDAARQGFDAGKFSFLETLDAQRTLVLARVQHLKSVADLHRLAADLDRLLGDSLTEQN